MKLFLIISVTVALCHGGLIKEDRYAWLPNDDAELTQVDLQQPIDEAARNARAGRRNEYWLFTRQNPFHPQHLTINDVNQLAASNYRSNVPTKVLVHGWTNNGDYIMNIILREVFLADSDCNIIVVDWNEVASQNYALAVLRVPSVGRYLGDFLKWLITTTGGSWDKFHLVGFSLGAHIVGNAGFRVGGLPARVTALDPAGPLWHINPYRITKRAGQYVEGIHTNGALLLNMLNGHGIMDPVGHADFYPNGGATQPGCPTGEAGGCSHARAYELFAASIVFNNFRGRRCDNLAQAMNEGCVGAVFLMGNDFLTKRGSGLYGLKTTSEWPF